MSFFKETFKLEHSLWCYPSVNLSEFIGKTINEIIIGEYCDNDAIKFTCSDGSVYLMTHDQDCCEYVEIENIDGDLNNLLNTPIVMSEDVSNEADGDEWERIDDSYTWTFYKFATAKGYVTIRWFGSSNGYYSESVDLYRIEGGNK